MVLPSQTPRMNSKQQPRRRQRETRFGPLIALFIVLALYIGLYMLARSTGLLRAERGTAEMPTRNARGEVVFVVHPYAKIGPRDRSLPGRAATLVFAPLVRLEEFSLSREAPP